MEEAFIITKYIREYLFEPKLSWPKYWFEKRSYSRWAACEVLSFVSNNPYISASVLVEIYILQMECFLNYTENAKKQFMFTTAKETAEDILNILKGETCG